MKSRLYAVEVTVSYTATVYIVAESADDAESFALFDCEVESIVRDAESETSCDDATLCDNIYDDRDNEEPFYVDGSEDERNDWTVGEWAAETAELEKERLKNERDAELNEKLPGIE